MDSFLLVNNNGEIYFGKYVAVESFSSNKVVASGDDFSKVYEDAESHGFVNPVVFYVPHKDMVHVY